MTTDDNRVWVCELLSGLDPDSHFTLHMSWEGAMARVREEGFRPLPLIGHDEDAMWIRPNMNLPWDKESSWLGRHNQLSFENAAVYQMEVGW